MEYGIRRLREQAGLTKAELARRIGTSRVQVGRLEAGERKLTREWASLISRAIGGGVTAQDVMFPELVNPAGAVQVESMTDMAGDQPIPFLAVPASKFGRGTRFLSAELVAKSIGTTLAELESLVGVVAGTFDAQAESPTIDAALSPIVRIMITATEMAGGDEPAAIWFKHQPLPGWGGKTAYDLVRQGKAENVYAYLEAVKAGGYT